MTAGDIAALITALTALVAAVGTVMAQVSHMNWHAQAKQQPSTLPPPAPDATPKP